jgi:TBC1 domain family protein 5
VVDFSNNRRRWVRVLFGREFPFLEVLQIWDLLFSSSPSLDLVDYVCLAMLLRVRWDCKAFGTLGLRG